MLRVLAAPGGVLGEPHGVAQLERVVDEPLDERFGRTALGNDVHGEAGGSGVERGARTDAGDDRLGRQRRELLGDLPGDAARGDEDGADAAGGDVRCGRLGDRHPDGAVGDDEVGFEAEGREARDEGRLGDLGLRDEHPASGDRLRPLAHEPARGVVALGDEVDGVAPEGERGGGGLPDRGDPRGRGNPGAVAHEHVDRGRARDDEPFVLAAFELVERGGEGRRVLGAREVDERRDHRGRRVQPERGGDAVAPLAAPGDEHTPALECLAAMEAHPIDPCGTRSAAPSARSSRATLPATVSAGVGSSAT